MKYLVTLKNNQEGIVLVLTVVILSVIMLTATLIVGIVIVQLRLAGDIGDSVVAIYAADTGVECQLYNARHGASINCNTSEVGGNIIMPAGISIGTSIVGVPPNPVIIKSLGSYRTVKRQFQVDF